VDIDAEATIVTLGSTELLAAELDSPTPDSWARALAHAKARARTLSASIGQDLGAVLCVEQLETEPRVESGMLVRVTFRLSRGDQPVPDTGEGSTVQAPSVLESLNEELRAPYRRFRELVLSLSPRISARPSPIRNGKYRYEGFRVDGSRNMVYANFRAHQVILRFELAEDHGLHSNEFKRAGGRDWLEVHLVSPNQVNGAVELARKSFTRVLPELAQQPA
jgi:hypothetical protein